MARDPKSDPEKVGVYDSTPKDKTPKEKERSPKSGGMSTWLIAAVVIIVLVLLFVFLF